ncbi:MAG: CRTAC1 family protein [Capsulimonadales bacterium]|nr:CRTAC1 family protein [Capsulimonadales bacterium]
MKRPVIRRTLLVMTLSVALLWTGIASIPSRTPPPSSSVAAPSSSSAFFEEVAMRTGVRFTHISGTTDRPHFVEFAPGGCAFLDFDNDGFSDILLLQSGSADPPTGRKNPLRRPFCGLFRNRGDGTFADVTAGSGLDRDLGYLIGVAVGDFDNDGRADLFLTGFRANHLLRNTGGSKPRFEEVTRRMGLDRLHSTGLATAAAFGDYNNDGRLDLYVCYYSDWTWGKDGEYYANSLHHPDTHRLFRNDGDRFVDVSERAGIARERGRGLAVGFLDFDGDGWQDIFVANDQTPNMLWRNDRNGRFSQVAVPAGCAFGADHQPMAGMSVAIGDYDHSGRPSVYVTSRISSPKTLFKNEGDGVFRALAAEVGLAALDAFAFGAEFLDYDADGWEDLLVVNGKVDDENLRRIGISAPEPKQLFHNEGNGRFREEAATELGPLARKSVGRGLAIGDYDNDGRQDALVSSQNGPAELFRNRNRNGHHWVAFKTVGTRSNRDGLHARFVLTAGQTRQTATVRAGSSYLSASDRRVYFGLGREKRIESVEIIWPSGVRDRLTSVEADAIHLVTEGKGITGRLPSPRSRNERRRTVKEEEEAR